MFSAQPSLPRFTQPTFASRCFCVSRRTRQRRQSGTPGFFQVSEEVQDAVRTGQPVVALETTIYTHGFPYPENVALASHLESVVRAHGGIPATIGILGGIAKVGFSTDELIELIAPAGHKSTMKVSRRDLAFICGLGIAGEKLHGGTTIAGTMVLAHLAGIKVFATGGLGGVHRGGEVSMDISADLTELGRTPVAVISSGCKSFLDIPRTLEVLETQGVVVGTFADGREGAVDFPAFFSRESGVKSPRIIRDEREAAAMIFAQSRFPVLSGLHFANPVPEAASIPKEDMDGIIEESIRMAEHQGVHGSDNTPFILEKIRELSMGKSVVANRALIDSNVIRGTKVAVELARLELAETGIPERDVYDTQNRAAPAIATTNQHTHKDSETHPSPMPNLQSYLDVLIVGSLASDLMCDYAPLDAHTLSTIPALHTSNPVRMSASIGGVGHNVALAAHLAGAKVELSSVVGKDMAGDSLLLALEAEGLSADGIRRVDNASTAQYIAVNDEKKDLFLAVADMAILEAPQLASANIWDDILQGKRPKWLVVDGNWSAKIIKHIVMAGRRSGARIAFEPVSVEKSARLLHQWAGVVSESDVVPDHLIDLVTPNSLELDTMYRIARGAGLFSSERWWQVIDAFNLSSAGSRDKFVYLTNQQLADAGVPQQTIQLLPFLPCIVTKLGKAGALLTQLLPPEDPRLSNPAYAPYILSRADLETGRELGVGGVYMRLFPAAEVMEDDEIVSVNGVGDTLLGVLIAGLARVRHREVNVEEVLEVAQKASVLTLKSKEAVGKDVKSLQREIERRLG